MENLFACMLVDKERSYLMFPYSIGAVDFIYLFLAHTASLCSGIDKNPMTNRYAISCSNVLRIRRPCLSDFLHGKAFRMRKRNIRNVLVCLLKSLQVDPEGQVPKEDMWTVNS